MYYRERDYFIKRVSMSPKMKAKAELSLRDINLSVVPTQLARPIFTLKSLIT